MLSLLRVDVSGVPRHRRAELRAPLPLRLLLCLLMLLDPAIYAALYAQWSPFPEPVQDVDLDHWVARPNSYCSRSEGSVSVGEDMGFGGDLSDCQRACARNPDCHMLSFGRWNRGLYPTFGGHFGQMRCQLYNTCAASGWSGMTIFAKPGSRFHKAEKAVPPILYLAPLLVDAIALVTTQSAGICFLAMLGFSATIFYRLRGATDPVLLLLVGLHFMNTALLFAIQWSLLQLARHLSFAGATPQESPSYLPRMPLLSAMEGPGKAEEPRMVVDLLAARRAAAGSEFLARRGGPGDSPLGSVAESEELDLCGMRDVSSQQRL